MADLKIEIGRTLEDIGQDFVKAWRGAEAGLPVEPTDRITFVNWEAYNSVLTPKRIELLKTLRREAMPSIRALARALDRDVKHVHADVVALLQLDIVTKDENGSLSTSVDEITATTRIAA